MSSASSKLPAELLRKVRHIEITTRRLIDQGVAGDYHSAFKGRGMEFAEVRPYEPGDEIRTIDWNVTARMSTPYVKRYVEERDLTVFLAVDVSGSLRTGSRLLPKRDLAAELAALLAFAAIRNNDRVGGAFLSDRLELFLRPERRKTHVLRLVREALLRPSHGRTDLEKALWSMLHTLKQRSVLFLLSDFVDSIPSGALKAAAARHDLVVIEIIDPREDVPPETGPILLEDAETGRIALIRAAQARKMGEHRRTERAELRQLLRRLGVDHLEIRTDRPYLQPLVSFFERRRSRR